MYEAVSNILDPDHARHLVWPDLESNSLERLLDNGTISIYICVSFQECSWIQDFESDFPHFKRVCLFIYV